jgi:hypothetical protein
MIEDNFGKYSSTLTAMVAAIQEVSSLVHMVDSHWLLEKTNARQSQHVLRSLQQDLNQSKTS